MVLALALVSGAGASQIELESSYVALLPDDAPELRDRDAIQSALPSTTELVLAIEGEPDERNRFADAVLPRLRESEHVLGAEYRAPTEFFEERWLYFLEDDRLERFRETLNLTIKDVKGRSNPLFVSLDDEDYDPWADLHTLIEEERDHLGIEEGTDAEDAIYVSPDGTRSYLLIQPAGTVGEFTDSALIVDEIQSAINRADPGSFGVEATLTGRLLVTVEEHEVLSGDMVQATLLALVVVVLLMVSVTRRAATLLVIGVPLVLGISMTLALTAMTLGHLNMISGFMIPALVGLGVDFCIHLYLRYLEGLDGGAAPGAAMVDAMVSMFPPCLASALTTSVAFLALLVNDFKAISEYGTIASYGVVITLMATFVALPPLALLLVRKPRARRDHQARVLGRRAALGIGLVSGLLVAAALAFVGRVEFYNDFAKLRGDSSSGDEYTEVTEEIGSPIDPSVIMVSSLAESRLVETKIDALKADQEEGEITNFGRVASLAPLVPENLEARADVVRDMRKKVERLAKRKKLRADDRQELDNALKYLRAEPWTQSDLPEVIQSRFVSTDGQRQFVFFWKEHDINIDRQIVAWSERVEGLRADLDADESIDAHLLDELSVTARVVKLLREDFGVMFGVACGAVLFIIALVFRRPGKIFLVAGSLTSGVVVMLGVMGVMGIDFNLFNVVVLPSIVGIGIDNAVHIQHGYDELGPGRVGEVIATRGRAAALSSATTAVGFGAMVVAHHEGVFTLGAVALIGMASTFFLTTLTLPALLRLREGATKSV